MAAQTITTDINVDSIAAGGWRANDTLTINAGATVTVNSDQYKFWNSVSINDGKLRIENTSTVSAIRFLMGRVSGAAAQTITPASGLGAIEIVGNWIEIGVGTGAAGQVFTTPYTDAIAAVWVETAPGSGAYESWANAGCAYGYVPKHANIFDLSMAGSGRMGMVFEQIADSRTIAPVVLTNCTLASGSRVATVSSTDTLSPGCHITGSSGIVANTVIERVISPTQFEMNVAATVNSSTVTLTIYRTYSTQLTNQIRFGNGVAGAVVPAGCRVRIPNIMITSVFGEQLGTGANTGVSIVLTNSGNLVVDTALFDIVTGAFTQPQLLSLKRCGFTQAQSVSKVSSIDIDDVVFSATPTRQYWASGVSAFELVSYSRGGHRSTFSYLAGGSIRKLYLCERLVSPGSTNSAMLYMQYCNDVQVTGLRALQMHPVQTSRALYLQYVNDCVFDGVESYGVNPILGSTIGNNVIKNILFCLVPYAIHSSLGTISNQGRAITVDPATGDWLEANTPYYIQAALYGDALLQYKYPIPEQAAVPHQTPQDGGYGWLSIRVLGSSVVFNWVRKDPTHTDPAVEIFRSTDPAVPVRGASTRVFTTNSPSIVTATDSTVVVGTQYYYVFRKHNAAGVYIDSPVLPAKAASVPAYTNLLLQSRSFSNAQWVKSNVTVSGTPNAIGVVVYPGDLRSTISSCLSTAAGGTISNTVTGLTIGQTYTATMWVTASPTIAANVVTDTAPVRLTFGTAFVDAVATTTPQRLSVQFTATATSHALVLRIDNNASRVLPDNAMVVLGTATDLSDVITTATINPAVFMPSSIEMRTRSRGGEPRPQGIGYISPSVTTTNFWGISISKVAGASFNVRNAVASYGGAASAVELNTASVGNTVDGVYTVGEASNEGLSLYLTGSSSRNIIKNVSIGMAGHGYTSSNYYAPIYVRYDANSNKFKNIYHRKTTGYIQYASLSPVFTENSAYNLVLENIRMDFSQMMYSAQCIGQVAKGCPGGAASAPDGTVTLPVWSMGSAADGVTAVPTAVFDNHFAELYHTETTGALNIFFTASTSTTPPYVLSGNAAFSNTGRLYFREAGASIAYTWPHKILGVSGFQNIPHKALSTDLDSSSSYNDTLQAVLLEYQIDQGAGYSEWQAATPANLSALSVSAVSGFYLRLRLTARKFFRYGSQSNSFVVGETVRHTLSGGTARVVEDYDFGTGGVVVVDQVVGSWSGSSAIVRDSDSQARASMGTVNLLYELGPTYTSYMQGLQIHTYIDQSVMYPDVTYTLTVTNIPAGAEVRIRQGSHTLDYIAGVSSGEYSYTYEYIGDDDYAVVSVTKSGYTIDPIRVVLKGQDQSVEVKYEPDPSYE